MRLARQRYVRFYIKYLLRLRNVYLAVPAIKTVQGGTNAGTTFGVLASLRFYMAHPPWTKVRQKIAAIYIQTFKSGAQKEYFNISFISELLRD